MSTKEQLVEQHIKAYHSKLQHLDELAEQAEAAKDTEHHDELSVLKAERDKLAGHLAKLKHESPDSIIGSAGPMAIWDLVAERLEKLVEKIRG
ncbi:MAG: hypothetical protein ACR2PS_02400 [Pseudomonadales bacterium]